MTALNVTFAGDDGPIDFNPKRDNWRRSAKVPVVVLNATSLNTGYGWQFAATWMGEPTIPVTHRIDSLEYCERIYYADIAPERVPSLGVAVAASACVPGLFPPVALPGVVAKRTLRLVDGGVNDNQGTEALLDHDCTAIFVSDASGQIAHSDSPSGTRLPSALRSSSLSRARLRVRGHREVTALGDRRTTVRYIHLTNGLRPARRKFTEGPDYDYFVPGQGSDIPWTANREQLTDFDVPREMQQALADIRTDLDRFSEDEADALMYSGYRQTIRTFEHGLPDDFPVATRVPHTDPDTGWRFLRMADVIDERGERYRDVMRQLRKGRHRFARGLRRGTERSTGR